MTPPVTSFPNVCVAAEHLHALGAIRLSLGSLGPSPSRRAPCELRPGGSPLRLPLSFQGKRIEREFPE